MAICPECHRLFPDDVADCPDHGVPLVPDSVFANVDRELEPGTQIGDYEVESLLGEGAFGRVYRAVHPVIGRRVAIKVLSRALSTDPQVVSRFISEARAIVEIKSPYIVDIFSFGTLDDGSQYYVMDLLDGSLLTDFLQEHGALEPQVALPILDGIAEALSAAHAAGVVHRDLKPDNVFIAFTEDGQPVPKLLDFGVAKLVGKHGLGHHTSTGALIGTPAYMAPEQALGLAVDHRSDIYAFGIVAFEMLTGRPPFEADSLVALVQKHTQEQAPALSTLRPEMGTAFDRAVALMLDKDPASRPASMDGCRQELHAAAADAGLALSLPDLRSLRPAPATPSQAGPSTSTWDDETLPADEQVSAPQQRPPAAVAADTVGGTTGAAELVEALNQARRPPLRALVGVGALVVLGTGLFVLTRPETPVDPVPAAGSERQTTATADAAGVSTTAAAAPESTATVELRVETAAKGAHVFLGGRDHGAAPGPFTIARGDEPVRIEVRADGYETAEVTFVPNTDQVVKPPLKAKPGQRHPGPLGGPPSTAKTSASVSPEIEPPPWANQ